MGCAGSRETETVDYKNVPPFSSEYPYPEAPKRQKSAVMDQSSDSNIESNIQKIPKGTESSYTKLLQYLSQGASSEAYHVRAIYLWIADAESRTPTPEQEKEQQKQKQTVATGDTPEGYIRMIKEKTGDRTTLFTIMCRRSGIPCVMIDGIGKNDRYNIGSNRNMETRWTAVRVDEEWRLIHVDWGLKLRRHGKRKESDFYFMTDPEEFAPFCHPEKNQWQLVETPLSRKEFMNLPYITPKFFDLGMMIMTPRTAINKSIKGKSSVEVTLPRKQMNCVQLTYKLTCVSTPKESDSDEASNRHKPVPSRLERYVFMNRKPSRYIYEIQLPVRGKYNFDILGMRTRNGDKHDTDANDSAEGNLSEEKDKLERLCQFRFICDKEPDDDIEPLPESPDIGWGPGPVCKQNGLIPLSHFEGQIYIKPGDLRHIRFRNQEDKEVQTMLVHSYLPAYDLVNQVETEEVGDEARFKVRIPEEGQYALKIYTRDEGEKDYKETCNYLLRQQVKEKVQEKHRDRMIRRRLEHHIVHHTSEKELKDALGTFDCYNVPDQGEKKRAVYKLKNYWEIKKGLNGAVMGRNKGVLHKWVQKARASKYQPDLEEDIQRAERMQGNMQRLKGYLHPVARMDPHTILEIRNYKRPPPVVHDVMASTYTLLGEDYGLDDWTQIQYLMGQTGKESLQQRILNRHSDDVTPEDAAIADRYIGPHSLQQCREASTEAATFYKWSKQFIRTVQQREMTEAEREVDDSDVRDRKTYRDYTEGSRLGSRDSEREPVVFKGRDHTRVSEEHPFAISKEADRQSDVSEAKRKTPDTMDEARYSEKEKSESYEDKMETRHNPAMFWMNPTISDQSSEKPISYAGFKPR